MLFSRQGVAVAASTIVTRQVGEEIQQSSEEKTDKEKTIAG
jgi:hypothetical protein